MKDNLIFLQDHISKKENEIITPIIDKLSKGKLSKDDKNMIVKKRKIIITIIEKYEEEFNEIPNDDIIDTPKTVDEIEIVLDSKISKYSGFSESHPMNGVSYTDGKQTWRLQINGSDTASKHKNVIIEKAKHLNFPDSNDSDIESREILQKNLSKNYFMYQTHYFTIYWNDHIPLFDIQHIISVLNLKPTYINEKYNKYVNDITNYLWHKNKFGGYILRELITETTMFNILMSSNSNISKSFKKDISEILSNLRKSGNLNVDNDKISIKKLKKHANIDHDSDNKISNIIDKHEPLSYDNTMDMMKLHQLINQMTYTSLTPFLGQSVLYAFVLALKRSHRYVIVKFGWTDDLLQRIKDLQSSFACNLYLIGLKKIRKESIEKQFHKTLKMKFPNNIEDIDTRGKNTVESYKFDMLMMTEFYAVEEDYSTTIQNVVLSSEQYVLVNLIKNQNISFRDAVMSQLNLNNMITNTSDSSIIADCAKIHYDFLIMQSNNIHLETMKRLEIDSIYELEKLKYEKYKLDRDHEHKMINANIELKKMDIKLCKLNAKHRKK